MSEERGDDEPLEGEDASTVQDDDSLFDRVVPENLKRRFEAGVDSVLRDRRVKHLVDEFKLPRELINHAKAQMDETKRAAVEVIARETREFLEQTNLADELAKLLTQVTLQVDVRFIPNDKAIKSTKDGDQDKKSGLFARFRSSPPPASEEETEATEATEGAKEESSDT
jgi:hypothetical protein